MLSHDSLGNYYKTNFAVMQHHNYSLSELDEMMPWEREVYIRLLLDHLKEEERRQKEEEQKQKQQEFRHQDGSRTPISHPPLF